MSRPYRPRRTMTCLAVAVSMWPLQATWAQATLPEPVIEPDRVPAPAAPAPVPAAASFSLQDFAIGLGSWTGALTLDYINSMQSSSGPDDSSFSTTTSAFSESLKIGNIFYVVNPLLLNGSFSVDLRRTQGTGTGIGIGTGAGTARQGNVIGYAFDASILEQKPYTAELSANRIQVNTLQPSGGRVVGLTENRRASLHLRQDSIFKDWGYPWLEANLRFEQGKNQTTSSNFGLTQSIDEKNRRLVFDAKKGFETADLGVNYQISDQQNAAFRQSNFRYHVGNLTYSRDFGPNLNRRLDSSVSYSARDGIAPSTTRSLSEHLRLDHYQNLYTDYQYSINQVTNNGAISSAQQGTFSVAHQWYKNLNSTATFNANRNTFPNGSLTSSGALLGQRYSHSLPGKGNLSLNWSGGYQLARNKLNDSTIGVVDEVHVAEPPLITRTGFLLNHKFGVAGSVVVLNVKNGGRIPLRDAAAVGPGLGDYEVINENNQIRIVPLPTSLLVAANDPLAISYSYQTDADLASETRSAGVGMSLSYPGMSMSLGHRQSRQTPLNQASTLFLQNTQNDFARLGLQGRFLTMATHADLALESNRTTDTARTKRELGAGLVREDGNLRTLLDLTASTEKYTLPDRHVTNTRSARSSVQWSNMSLTAGVNAIDSRYTSPSQRTDTLLSAQTSLNWSTESGWIHSASLDWSRRKVGELPTETLVQATGKSSVTLGLLSLNANVGLGRWLRGGSRSNNRSFYIAAVRQF